MLVQVTAPHFCAGLVLENDRAVRAAPILAKSIGRTRAELSSYFRQRGWKAVVVNELPSVQTKGD